MLLHVRIPPLVQEFDPLAENICRHEGFLQRFQMNRKLLVVVGVLRQAGVVKNPHQTLLQREMGLGQIGHANNGRIGGLPVILGHCPFDVRDALDEHFVLFVDFMNTEPVLFLPFHDSSLYPSTRTESRQVRSWTRGDGL